MKNCAFVYLGLIDRSPLSFIIVHVFSLLSERFVIDICYCLLEQDFSSFIIFSNDPLLARSLNLQHSVNKNIKGINCFVGSPIWWFRALIEELLFFVYEHLPVHIRVKIKITSEENNMFAL